MSLQSVLLHRNLSRLELGLAVIVVMLLTAVFMERVDRLAATAERVSFNATLLDIRTRVALFDHVLRTSPAADLPADDALRLAVRTTAAGMQGHVTPSVHDVFLARFLSDINEMGDRPLKKGEWGFDNLTGELVYRIGHRRAFESGDTAADELRFELRLDFADRDDDGRLDPAVDRLLAARLVALDEVRH